MPPIIVSYHRQPNNSVYIILTYPSWKLDFASYAKVQEQSLDPLQEARCWIGTTKKPKINSSKSTQINLIQISQYLKHVLRHYGQILYFVKLSHFFTAGVFIGVHRLQ